MRVLLTDDEGNLTLQLRDFPNQAFVLQEEHIAIRGILDSEAEFSLRLYVPEPVDDFDDLFEPALTCEELEAQSACRRATGSDGRAL
jgi:hypothetical protein